MDIRETTKFLALLKTAYPRYYNNLSREETIATINLWHKMLTDIPYNKIEIALEKLLSINIFPPTIAEVRKAVIESTSPIENDVGEAWQEVITAIQRFGYQREKEALESLNGLTRKAVENIGYKTLCLSETQMVDRAHFFKIYEVYKNRKLENNILPEETREKIKQLQEDNNLNILPKEELKVIKNIDNNTDSETKRLTNLKLINDVKKMIGINAN